MIGFVGARGGPFELLEFAEEVFDEVTGSVKLEGERRASSWKLEDDDLRAALVRFGDHLAAVEGLFGEQRAKFDALDQRRDADRIEALPRQRKQANQIAERVDEREDFAGPAAFGVAYSLALIEPASRIWTVA
jgi:hypothetical protein